MRTTITKQVKFDPEKREIYFFENGVPKHGFAGPIASRKFLEACNDKTIDVMIIDRKNEEKTKLIRQFRAILAKKGLEDIKDDILAQYGVESTKDLTVEQLKEQIDILNGSDVRPEVRQWRSNVLTALGKLGIYGSKEDNFIEVNNYLEQPRIAGKILYKMNLSELKACHKKLKTIKSK
ncbi:hypothetical protein LJC16_02235 [Bacteroidales bacterium OttesenSCG-928-C19]|nr:hypothetical protein [Bacteroidales bacterium OttesenSCG-928-C19]